MISMKKKKNKKKVFNSSVGSSSGNGSKCSSIGGVNSNGIDWLSKTIDWTKLVWN